jgi:hypothetical protein
MNRRQFVAILPSLLAAANEPQPKPLFDGRTLDGWTIQDGPESSYYVTDGYIVGSPAAEYPAWLRSARQYENFDLEFEYFLKGWMDGGVYFSAPEHGSRSRGGFKVSLFHQQDADMRTNSPGAIFPVVAPRLVNVKNKGEWNTMRIRLEWPKLEVWSNGEQTHSHNVETNPELRYKLRSGYIGLDTLSYPLRFRNIRIRELAPTTTWQPSIPRRIRPVSKWTITESNERSPARFEAMGRVLRSDGLGNFTTKRSTATSPSRCMSAASCITTAACSSAPTAGANDTKSSFTTWKKPTIPPARLYYFARAKYPRIEPEQWFLYQMWVKDRSLVIRINGETILEYDRLGAPRRRPDRAAGPPGRTLDGV